VAPAAEELLAQLQQARQRLSAGLRWRLAAARARLEGLAARRAFRRPLQYVQDMTRRLDEWDARSARAVRRRLRLARRQVDQAVARLESLSPLAVLGRGYSVTRRAADGQIVRDAGQLAPAEQIVTRFAHGQATSRVEGIDVTGPSRRGTSSRGG
jgi:exodeoxyribonuclease VII large subunit